MIDAIVGNYVTGEYLPHSRYASLGKAGRKPSGLNSDGADVLNMFKDLYNPTQSDDRVGNHEDFMGAKRPITYAQQDLPLNRYAVLNLKGSLPTEGPIEISPTHGLIRNPYFH